jgi:hypothetical protein
MIQNYLNLFLLHLYKKRNEETTDFILDDLTIIELE